MLLALPYLCAYETTVKKEKIFEPDICHDADSLKLEYYKLLCNFENRFLLLTFSGSSVVYFDQQMGAVQNIGWSECVLPLFILFSLFCKFSLHFDSKRGKRRKNPFSQVVSIDLFFPSNCSFSYNGVSLQTFMFFYPLFLFSLKICCYFN